MIQAAIAVAHQIRLDRDIIACGLAATSSMTSSRYYCIPISLTGQIICHPEQPPYSSVTQLREDETVRFRLINSE